MVRVDAHRGDEVIGTARAPRRPKEATTGGRRSSCLVSSEDGGPPHPDEIRAGAKWLVLLGAALIATPHVTAYTTHDGLLVIDAYSVGLAWGGFVMLFLGSTQALTGRRLVDLPWSPSARLLAVIGLLAGAAALAYGSVLVGVALR